MKLGKFLFFVAVGLLVCGMQICNSTAANAKSADKPATTALSTHFADRWEIQHFQEHCYEDEDSNKEHPTCPASPFSYPPVLFPTSRNPTEEEPVPLNIFPKREEDYSKEEQCLKTDVEADDSQNEKEIIEDTEELKVDLIEKEAKATEESANIKPDANNVAPPEFKESEVNLKLLVISSSNDDDNDGVCSIDDEKDGDVKRKSEVAFSNKTQSKPKANKTGKYFNETLENIASDKTKNKKTKKNIEEKTNKILKKELKNNDDAIGVAMETGDIHVKEKQEKHEVVLRSMVTTSADKNQVEGQKPKTTHTKITRKKTKPVPSD